MQTERRATDTIANTADDVVPVMHLTDTLQASRRAVVRFGAPDDIEGYIDFSLSIGDLVFGFLRLCRWPQWMTISLGVDRRETKIASEITAELRRTLVSNSNRRTADTRSFLDDQVACLGQADILDVLQRRVVGDLSKGTMEIGCAHADDAPVLRKAACLAGMDADALCRTGPGDSELDAIVVANTNEAIDREVFSASGYVFFDEIMWGQDRRDFVDKRLEKMR